MVAHFLFCLTLSLCCTYAQEYLWYSTWDYDYPSGNSPLVRGTIQRTGSAITGLTNLQTIALGASRGISLDPINQHVYWCKYVTSETYGIYRSNFDGSNLTLVVPGVNCALVTVSGQILCYANVGEYWSQDPSCGIIQQEAPYVTNLNALPQFTSSFYDFELNCVSDSTCFLYWGSTADPILFQKSTIDTSVVPFQVTATTTLATVTDTLKSLSVDNSTDIIYYSQSTGSCLLSEYAISSANPDEKCIFPTSWKLSIHLPPMCRNYLLYVTGDSDNEPGGGATIQLVDRSAGTNTALATNVSPFSFAAYLTQCPSSPPVPISPPPPVPPPVPVPASSAPIPTPPQNLICTKLYHNSACSGEPYDNICGIGDICWNGAIQHCSSTDVTTTYSDNYVITQPLGCSTTGTGSMFVQCSSAPPADIVTLNFYGSSGCSGAPSQGAYLQNVCYGEANPNPYSTLWVCEGENIVQNVWNSIDCTGASSQVTTPATCQGTSLYLCGNSTYSYTCGSDTTFSPHVIALLCWFLLAWAM